MTRSEHEQICQRMLDEQGYIVLCGNVARKAGEVIEKVWHDYDTDEDCIHAKFGVIGPATREEFIRQVQHYYGEFPKGIMDDRCYFCKVAAE